MYRLMLYYLIALLAVAVGLCFLGILSFKPFDLIFSSLILVAICWIANKIFASTFQVPANVESVYITALILALIITPPQTSGRAYFAGLGFLFWASVWAMASKYMLAWRGKHIFNPAAFAVALTALTINQSASWWVGTLWMMPFVVIGGLLVTRKIRRFDLILSFLVVGLIAIVGPVIFRSNPITTTYVALVNSPILFFSFVMLSEPLTTPPTKKLRISYGIVTGLLSTPALHFGGLYSTPELALLAGNVFSYLVSPKQKYLLALKSKEEAGADTYDFIFRPNRRVKFRPGQYMEWTLGHKKSDSRGNRRYFTIASSPTERDVRLGVKFYDQPSSFKRTMLALPTGRQVLAGQLAGDFTLPHNPAQKLVFIAGGIGITPFRSMLKYLVDRNERRNIILFYSNKLDSEVVYADVLVQAHEKLGVKTVLTLTDQTKIPTDWQGYTGYINAAMIAKEVPDYKQRSYYISGPHSMVTAFEKVLKDMGIPNKQIKIDFFPGFA